MSSKIIKNKKRSSSTMEEEDSTNKTKEQLDQYELFGFNNETFSKHLKDMKRYHPDILYHEISSSANPDKYEKELRRQNQAKLARRLHRNTSERLGVTEPLYNVELYKKYSEANNISDTSKELKGKPSRSRLSKVSIYPAVKVGKKVGKKVTIREMIGTLEAYLNGFRFSPYGKPQVDIMYSDVKHAFFQDGDQTISPLLHLHLHSPIMVGKEKRKDIQFRMVQPSGKQKYMIRDLNPVMRNFLAEVDDIWNQFPTLFWRRVEREYGFPGKLPLKKSRVFCLTGYCLVELVEVPPLVVALKEVEIVSLVLVEPARKVFNMTFVYKDFERAVNQIYSIPVTELDEIKEQLDIVSVKYYQNNDLNLSIKGWRSKLKEITSDPVAFMGDGGWRKFNGESDASYSDSSAASMENWSDFPDDCCPDDEPSVGQVEPGQASSSGLKTREKNEMPSTRIMRTRKVGKEFMVTLEKSDDECESTRPDIEEWSW